ncbi:glycoside hydrolase family 2 TIM barrel-domain containing protein [Rhizosphaericola mali]|uniref:1,4-beta-xylanase n=1 Tax=Rhizosphaericola mali TaxID=2545455 RepID=A0A5P2G022_9BACT|nr:glycoside hydrolase family 2 TIM barrel-domain containing protein [Rhizosphaericola mali]QES88577.1 1,4-beta-xylanase [Rhizosphaericola mali]
MKKIVISIFSILWGIVLFAQNNENRWSESQAKSWYEKTGWLSGCNFIPSTAINQLEMWQSESFDTATIDRELGWAHSIGFNSMRVFLHHALWQQDAKSFKQRIDQYLSISTKNQIKTIFVFFDDCWNESYHLGTQPAPKLGVHNSGWVRDPGGLLYQEPLLVDTLRNYVVDILNTFKDDARIALWDLYNEAGNSNYKLKSLPLLKKVFDWSRTVTLSQPVSSGVWNPELKEINTFILQNSDIVTYHDYQAKEKHLITIDTLKKYNRPMVCTEYMARRNNSTFKELLPILKENHIGAINWGLVAGKTNTIFAWDTPIKDGKEPKLWFHDIFRANGTPYKKDEIEVIKKYTLED